MSEVELKKQKVFQLIQEFEDENLLDEVINFLQEKKHTITAEEIFSKISSRYDNTLRKLAQ